MSEEYKLKQWYASLLIEWGLDHYYRYNTESHTMTNLTVGGTVKMYPVELHPTFWTKVQQRNFVDDIIDEPLRTLKPKEPTPYEVHQRRNNFLLKFSKSTEMYNHSAAFRRITELVANGADFYELISTLFTPGKPLNELYKDKLNETK